LKRFISHPIGERKDSKWGGRNTRPISRAWFTSRKLVWHLLMYTQVHEMTWRHLTHSKCHSVDQSLVGIIFSTCTRRYTNLYHLSKLNWQCILKYGASVLLDPTWDIHCLSRCSKAFPLVLKMLCASKPASLTLLQAADDDVLTVIIDVLGQQGPSDQLQHLRSGNLWHPSNTFCYCYHYL
jgi:hypothetical protein